MSFPQKNEQNVQSSDNYKAIIKKDIKKRKEYLKRNSRKQLGL